MSRLRPGRPLKPFRRPWLWAGLWIAAIATVLVASLSPAPPLPPVDNSDKLGHFLAYAVLAIGAVQLYARWASLLGAGIGLVLLGVGIEYAQGALTATRVGDPADALANTLGVIAGLATRLTPWRDALLRFDGGRR
ncbi:VanZ family protein [Luteimonas sp. MHLX1A]|uniref:VanZ family protein n=1 Tax=Alterluteimonas muca TaxID=2878684 RepID=UPI001E65CCA4|nr:VanZ family protein [Luteimonas sp. MHLX1A]